jgi:argininosuccinate lyase
VTRAARLRKDLIDIIVAAQTGWLHGARLRADEVHGEMDTRIEEEFRDIEQDIVRK